MAWAGHAVGRLPLTPYEHTQKRGEAFVVTAKDAATPPVRTTKDSKPKRPRLDWATLHQRTFGTDVLRCPCGGERLLTCGWSPRSA